MKLFAMLIKPDLAVITDPDERQRQIQDELDDFVNRKADELYDGCYEGVGRPKVYTGAEAQQRRATRIQRQKGAGTWASGFAHTQFH